MQLEKSCLMESNESVIPGSSVTIPEILKEVVSLRVKTEMPVCSAWNSSDEGCPDIPQKISILR
jgi:hypothetical protein